MTDYVAIADAVIIAITAGVLVGGFLAIFAKFL